jgi:hypothetical protein
MSFEQLMEHASDIQFKAIKHAMANNETEPEYARNGVDGYYAKIPELFKPFFQMPNPKKYEPAIEDLRAVLRGLSNGSNNQDPIDKNDFYPANPTLAKMTTAGDYLEDWTGKSAMQFKQKFLDPFPAYSRNQFILTAALKSALEAHQALWTSTRNDIDKIAHATMDAFANQGCCDKNTWNVSFTVLSSIGAIGAAVLTVATAGTTLPLTLTAIGAAAQVGATVPPDGLPAEVKGGGETALQITNTMKSAMDKLTQEFQKAEQKVAEALTVLGKQVSQESALFAAARPALADGRISGPDGMGNSD